MPLIAAQPPSGPAPALADVQLIAECNIYPEGRKAGSVQISHRLELLKSWQIKSGDKVLEVGCGQGDATSVLAAAVGANGHVTAVDPAPLTYGAPWTLEQAQNYLSASPLGHRISWIKADPIAYLAAHPTNHFNVAILCHSIFYFASPSLLHETLSALAQHADRVIISEYALSTTTPSAHAHVLAVLAEAALECHKPSSTSNVRTVVSPATLKRVTAEVGLRLETEEVVVPTKELQDGRWELQAVLNAEFVTQVEANVKDEREKEVVFACRDACLAAVELAGGLKECTTMDIWTGLSQILNSKPYDPFADVGDSEEATTTTATEVEASKKNKEANVIHIRIQQRNGRKTITTLQGVPTEYDPKKLLKAFKKEFACNGSLVDDEDMGRVIQLQGDQRTKIMSMLLEEGISKETIKLHGF